MTSSPFTLHQSKTQCLMCPQPPSYQQIMPLNCPFSQAETKPKTNTRPGIILDVLFSLIHSRLSDHYCILTTLYPNCTSDLILRIPASPGHRHISLGQEQSFEHSLPFQLHAPNHPHWDEQQSKPSCQQRPPVLQTKSKPWSIRLVMMSLPTLPGSSHADASSFSHMLSPFLPSGIAFAGFLHLESTIPQLLTKMHPGRCSNLKGHLLREVCPHTNRACMPATHNRLT